MHKISQETLRGWYARKDSTDRALEAQERAENEPCEYCDGTGEVMAAPDRVEGGEIKDAVYRPCICTINEDDEK